MRSQQPLGQRNLPGQSRTWFKKDSSVTRLKSKIPSDCHQRRNKGFSLSDRKIDRIAKQRKPGNWTPSQFPGFSRSPYKQDVIGSNPIPPIFSSEKNSPPCETECLPCETECLPCETAKRRNPVRARVSEGSQISQIDQSLVGREIFYFWQEGKVGGDSRKVVEKVVEREKPLLFEEGVVGEL